MTDFTWRTSLASSHRIAQSALHGDRVRPRLGAMRWLDHSLLHPGRALTVREIGALSDLDNITVGITDVAADLAVLGNRLGYELGSSTFP